MNVALMMADYLSTSQVEGLANVLSRVEFLPVSCLLHRGDAPRVISPDRVIPDDFIYAPTKGELDCLVAGEGKRIHPGEFMMVPAGVKHTVSMAPGTRSYEVFAFHMHIYDETRNRFLHKMDAAYGVLSEKDAWFARMAACACLMGRDAAAGGVYMERLVIALLLDQILRGAALREVPDIVDERISGLLGEIRSRPAHPWTVATMASQCHLSESRFRQLFASVTGHSPKKYVQRVRLSLARSLLHTQPSLTVGEVAAQVGISDAHYLHEIYKQQFGETPKRGRIQVPK